MQWGVEVEVVDPGGHQWGGPGLAGGDAVHVPGRRLELSETVAGAHLGSHSREQALRNTTKKTIKWCLKPPTCCPLLQIFRG